MNVWKLKREGNVKSDVPVLLKIIYFYYELKI